MPSAAASDLGMGDVPLPKSDPRTKEFVLQYLQQHEKDTGVPMEKWGGSEITKLQKKLGVGAGDREWGAWKAGQQ